MELLYALQRCEAVVELDMCPRRRGSRDRLVGLFFGYRLTIEIATVVMPGPSVTFEQALVSISLSNSELAFPQPRPSTPPSYLTFVTKHGCLMEYYYCLLVIKGALFSSCVAWVVHAHA
jgi:hypothetical protein